jgi:UDP-N-acetyl-2-amino-2-deoxyglucuronate dehydrogenase
VIQQDNQKERIMGIKPLKAGIIGCGVIAPTHAEAFSALPDVELAWACDLDITKAKKLAEAHGAANTTTDYQEVFDSPDVDIISICTDHASHTPIAIAALEANKHVLCEKALSASTEGLDLMLAEHAKRPELVFSGVFQHRFDAANQYIKQLIEQGSFGTVLTASLRMYCKRTDEYYQADDWRGTWDKEGGGVMINQALHFVDLLSWLAGRVESVCGAYAIRTHEGVIETEDTVTASLKFESGILGSIEATSSSSESWHPAFSINGSDGWLEMCNGKPTNLSFTDKELEEQIRAGLADCHDLPGVRTRKSYYGTGHAAQIEDFISAVREERSPFMPALQAAHAVDVVLAIYRSQNDGTWVNLPNRIV